jgi:phosphatidylglycerol:prolipoprotein diacylglycerol transferase
MQGQLFTLLGQGFPSYFVLLMTGFVLATVTGALWARRIGQNPDVVVDLGLAMVIAGVAGARILHVLVDGFFWDYVHLCTDPTLVDMHLTRAECANPDYDGIWDAARAICHPRQADCFAWAKFWSGGLTYYGGFIGAAAAAFFLLRRDRFPFWKGADMAGMVVPLGLGFGRMGCLLAGCCFGKPTEVPWALSFPPNSPASDWQEKHGLLDSRWMESLPVHPTQIYESAGSFAIAAVCLLYIHGRKRYDGQVFLAFIALYAALRFVLEIWRSDDRGAVVGLSTSQLVGLALIGAAYVAHRRLQAAQPEPAGPSVPPSSGRVAGSTA